MQYIEFSPRSALKDHIACFWSMVSSPTAPNEPRRHRVLPDCCADVIFDFTGARGRSPAYVVGTMTSPVLVTMDGQVDMLGIRFKPGAMRPFLKVPADECTDLTPDLDCFWGPAGKELWSRLAETPTSSARIAILEAYLLEQFGSGMALDPYVRFCVELIEKRDGNVSSRDLERGTGLSARQLERKFGREIGISPKAFSRIARFQNVIRRARAKDAPDWLTIAFNHGYSDQSHLVRDFREFSGLTPTAFIAEQ